MKTAEMSATITTIFAFFIPLNSACQAQVELEPVVVASIHDEPRDGDGDKFNVDPFEGLLRKGKTREDRAIVEFDLSPFVGRRLSKAQLRFQIAANNGAGIQHRFFDVVFYSGNGERGLTDYALPGKTVTDVSYHVPDHHRDFDLDIQVAIQVMLDNDVRFLGVRIVPRGDRNAPSIFRKASLLIAVEEGSSEAGDHIELAAEPTRPAAPGVLPPETTTVLSSSPYDGTRICECATPVPCITERVQQPNVSGYLCAGVFLPQPCCPVPRCGCCCVERPIKRIRRRAIAARRSR